ncbi:MAG: DUF309 domain-containing protein [Candidatus Omnitrophica bacterium]|nr:DUF309 domain-containing protein [Candidatus Omnitrophota bacterium]
MVVRRAGARPAPPANAVRSTALRAASRAQSRDAAPSPADPRLAEGLALFNHRRFFECHEVLERLWLDTAGRERDFYKGLIQAAVAFYHWSRRNPAGAMSLYRSSSRYLKKYRPACLGVDVEGFLPQYTELFQWLRRHHLPYDPRLVPAIRWTS